MVSRPRMARYFEYSMIIKRADLELRHQITEVRRFDVELPDAVGVLRQVIRKEHLGHSVGSAFGALDRREHPRR